MHAGIHTPWQVHPPWAGTPHWAGTPRLAGTPPPPTVTAADSKHPAGMISCSCLVLLLLSIIMCYYGVFLFIL